MRRLKAFLFAELIGSLLCVGMIVFGTALFMYRQIFVVAQRVIPVLRGVV